MASGLALALSMFIAAPQLPALPPIRRDPQVVYLDRTGALLGVRGGLYGPPVDVARLPAHVPGAFVAIEDRRFWTHSGVDPVGIARAIVTNGTEGRMAQGASTITQQVAKLVFLSPERTVERKAREALLAVQLEQAYTKRQILGLYLSRAYFGSGAYGVEQAARRYFAKPARELTVAEAAMLAGVLKSPTAYNPVEQPAAAQARARLVLEAMAETGVISAAQKAAALASPARPLPRAVAASTQYFIDYVEPERRRLAPASGEDLVVETTLDAALQRHAADVLSRTLKSERGLAGAQGAIVSMDGAGAVRALVGGADYVLGPYNRAVSARRQAGSAWKPLVYLAALEAGYTPDTLVVDEPVTLGAWSPQNYEGAYLGPITLQKAFALSINTVAVRLSETVGRDRVAMLARRLGITTPVPAEPAMALGTGLVSPLELAQAYGAFANGGRRVSAYGVVRIRTRQGRVLYERRPAAQVQAISNPALGRLHVLMRAVLTEGTGKRAAIAGRDLAGKTGTTSDYRDAWFAGYGANFVSLVWLGRDDAGPMGRVTGGTAPAAIWRSVMVKAYGAGASRPIPPGPAPGPDQEAPPPLEAILSGSQPADDPLGDILGGLEETVEPGPGAPQ